MKITRSEVTQIFKEELWKEILQVSLKTVVAAATVGLIITALGTVSKKLKSGAEAAVSKVENKQKEKDALAAFLTGKISDEQLKKAIDKVKGDKEQKGEK